MIEQEKSFYEELKELYSERISIKENQYQERENREKHLDLHFIYS